MAEAGYPGVDQDTWFGVAAPAGTPKAVVTKLFDLFVKASTDPALVKRASDDGVTIATSKSPQAFGELWTSEAARWGKIVRALNIKAAAIGMMRFSISARSLGFPTRPDPPT